MRFTDRFVLSVLNAGLSTGADYCEIYYQDDVSTAYTRRYHKVSNVSSGQTRGVGIRLIKNDRVVYGYSSDLSEKALLKLTKDLSFGFDGKRNVLVRLLHERKGNPVNSVRIGHKGMSRKEKLAYLERGEKTAFAYSDKIIDVITNLSEDDEHIEIYNSDGIKASDDRIRTKVTISVTAKQDGQVQQGYQTKGLSEGLELLSEVDFVEMAQKAAKTSIDLFSAVSAPSGELPVVLANGSGGVLFHEACGHPLEGSAVSKGLSPFSGKLGQKIASDIVSAFDDGTEPNGWGSQAIDDEGNLPTKNQLIKDGILNSYMLDRFTAKRIGDDLQPTGCCRREEYTCIPTTRMTNTYIANGKSTRDEIIKSVDFGIYCVDFMGGQVETNTDQFVFTSNVAYLIEDGKVTKMIKPVSLIGYGYEILNRITMIADDGYNEDGYCGASSGTCCVETGQPTLLISKILVGGQGGKSE